MKSALGGNGLDLGKYGVRTGKGQELTGNIQ